MMSNTKAQMAEDEHSQALAISSELLEAVARFIAFHKNIIERLEQENQQLRQEIYRNAREKMGVGTNG